jgi:hypothetical protein
MKPVLNERAKRSELKTQLWFVVVQICTTRHKILVVSSTDLVVELLELRPQISSYRV